MMTSRADVKQMGVVIRLAAERGMCVCVCVCMLGKGESMQCPLGFFLFCSQSEFWTDARCYVCAEEDKDRGREEERGSGGGGKGGKTSRKEKV